VNSVKESNGSDYDVGAGAVQPIMEAVPKGKQMALEFPHISAWVPDLFGPGSADSGNLFSKALQKLRLSKSTELQGKPKQRQVLHATPNSHRCMSARYRR
jgi:hypothetical protein